MTQEETVKFLGFMRGSYPSWGRDMSKLELNALVFSWCSHFADVPVKAVLMAFHNYQRTNKFAPTIADIEGQLKTLTYILAANKDDAELAGILASVNNHFYNGNSTKRFYDAITNNNFLGLEAGADG